MMTADLQAQWLATVRPFAVAETAAISVFLEISERYGGGGRYYHNLDHVAQVLTTLNEHAHLAQDLPALHLAAWFHDVIYDPRAGDNEAQSAEWAAAAMHRLFIPEKLITRVCQLIMMTQHHQCPTEEGDGWLLLDADLAILGAQPAIYEEYSKAIRREFAFVPEMVYVSARRQVLRSFIERERLYFHPPLFNKLEKQARKNLSREIDHYQTAAK